MADRAGGRPGLDMDFAAHDMVDHSKEYVADRRSRVLRGSG